MRNILIVARKEIQEGLAEPVGLGHDAPPRGPRPHPHLPRQRADWQWASALDVVIVSLSSLTIFLLPLIAPLISHDAIVGEMERGTMLLLLSYPVGAGRCCSASSWASLHPGFCDPHRIRSGRRRLAATGAIDAESWTAFASMVGSSILLGAAFIAVGYLVSALVRSAARRPGSPSASGWCSF